jgi:hypothetical protein
VIPVGHHNGRHVALRPALLQTTIPGLMGSVWARCMMSKPL